MKTRTTFATAAIALTLAASLQAAPDSRKKDNNKQDADTRQIERSFETIGRAVADARKSAGDAAKKHAETLKAHDAEIDRLRKEVNARKGT